VVAPADRLVEVGEAAPDLVVEGGVLLPPAGRVLRVGAAVFIESAEPELEDVVDGGHADTLPPRHPSACTTPAARLFPSGNPRRAGGYRRTRM
jgi:hypothetical protein